MDTQHVVIGAGEVGMAVMRLIAKQYNVLGIDIFVDKEKLKTIKNIEIMHVAIPYTDKFIEQIKEYDDIFKPKYIVIYSSVPPETTEKIGINAIHSPVEGRHPDLYNSISTFRRFISGPKAEELISFYESICTNGVTCFKDPKITELGKLLSTTRYGVNLMFADISNELCKKYDVNYKDVVLDYITMYNDGYNALGEKRFHFPYLTPPEHSIGGHCITENAKSLCKITKNHIIKMLSEYNKPKIG